MPCRTLASAGSRASRKLEGLKKRLGAASDWKWEGQMALEFGFYSKLCILKEGNIALVGECMLILRGQSSYIYLTNNLSN